MPINIEGERRADIRRKEDYLKNLTLHKDLSEIHDLDAVLEYLLTKARDLTNSDSGTIYIREGEKLNFRYAQNDSLFTSNLDNKNLYLNASIEINSKSISGYCAKNMKLLNISDAYKLENNTPYKFNSEHDKKSGYCTKSILTTPILNAHNKVIGVIQLLNAQNQNGEVTPFTKRDELIISYFANSTSMHIERAELTRKMILRMISIAALHDIEETAPHVNRVGAYSAELYEHWAIKNGMRKSKIKLMKGNIRLSSMLHDIGKLAISDIILKKPGRLTKDERALMKFHSIYGARLFTAPSSEIDVLASNLALNHHENWDGTGYPGKVKDIFAEQIKMDTGKQGDEIPIEGQIVKICDVYDALISRRCYKDAWSEEKTLQLIKDGSGTEFNPKLIECFFEIYDTIKAIRKKYTESKH